MRAVFVILAFMFCVVMWSQNLTRHMPSARRATPAAQAPGAVPDTLRDARCDSLLVSGFDKPLRAVRESMFVTNSSAVTVAGLGIEITYLDSRRRMLHKAVHEITCDIPPGETRRIEVRSFDRSGLFHYRLSPVPRGAVQATPFDVTVVVDYILTEPK